MANAGKHDFTFGRLTGLSENLGCTFYLNLSLLLLSICQALIILIPSRFLSAGHSAKSTPSTTDSSSSPPPPPPTTSEVSQRLNASIARIHASLPARSALIIFTGHADPRPMLALQERKKAFDAAFKKGPGGGGGLLPVGVRWMEEDERKLEAETAVAREGLGFFCVKV